MRVVVAEDHVLLRDGLTRLLTAYGCEVIAAVEGSEGLDEALQRPGRGRDPRAPAAHFHRRRPARRHPRPGRAARLPSWS